MYYHFSIFNINFFDAILYSWNQNVTVFISGVFSFHLINVVCTSLNNIYKCTKKIILFVINLKANKICCIILIFIKRNSVCSVYDFCDCDPEDEGILLMRDDLDSVMDVLREMRDNSWKFKDEDEES